MYKDAAEFGLREANREQPSIRSGWTHPLRSSIKWLIKEWQVRRTIEQLKSFDDHMLKDIGLARFEIEWVVRCGRGCHEL